MSHDRPRGMGRSASRLTRLHVAALSSAFILLCIAVAQRAPAQPAAAKPAPAQSEDKLEAARESVAAHRFAEAISLLESELAKNPENDEARSLLARVLSWQHRYDQSLAEYGRL